MSGSLHRLDHLLATHNQTSSHTAPSQRFEVIQKCEMSEYITLLSHYKWCCLGIYLKVVAIRRQLQFHFMLISLVGMTVCISTTSYSHYCQQ